MFYLAIVSSVKIFDGFEQELFNRHFELHVNGHGTITVEPGAIDASRFTNLKEVLGDAALSQIVEAKQFKYQSGLFPGYIGTDGLDLKYLIRDNVLLIFSLGEYQPSRYILYFEGAWEMPPV